MKRVTNIHLNYLLSRVFWIMFIILVFLSIIIYFLTINNINRGQSYQEQTNQYYYNMISYLQLTLSLLSVFIFSNGINNRNDNSIYLILTTKISRTSSILTKMIIMYLIILVFFLLQITSYFLVGLFFLDGFQIDLQHLYVFVIVFFISCYYGLLAMVLMQKTQNWFAGIFPYFVYILSIDLIQKSKYNNFEKIFFFLVVNVKVENGFLPYGLVHLFLMILFLVIMNAYYFLKRDL